MSQPAIDGEFLIEQHGVVKALEIATVRLETANPRPDWADRWHAEAVYCYVKGYNDAHKRYSGWR